MEMTVIIYFIVSLGELNEFMLGKCLEEDLAPRKPAVTAVIARRYRVQEST